MLQLFFGNDTVRVRSAAFEVVEEKKDEGFSPVTITSDAYESGSLSGLAGSASLFGGNNVVLIDTPSEDSALYDEVVELLPMMFKSNDLFVIIEGPLLAAERKVFEKHTKEVFEHKKGVQERFNNFALADALLKRDKRSLWVLLSEARLEGIADEEVVGVLWWQLKTLKLANNTANANEAGLKDFPYSKAKRALGKFGKEDLVKLSHSLMTLVHESRLGKRELDLALESWVLKV